MGQYLSRDCTSKLRCKDCGARHHASICDKSVKTSQPQTTFCQPSLFQNPDQGGGLGGCQQISTLYIDAKISVMLQTAHAVVSGTGPDATFLMARDILDTCSQRSYLSWRLKEDLKLPFICTEKLMIKTFGSEEGQMQECEAVQFSLRGLDNDLNCYMTAFVVPVICAPLQNQAIEIADQSYPHLKGMQLPVGPTEKPALEMDMLVSSDSYWNIVTRQIKRGNFGPVALNTRLRWVLSGAVNQPSSATSLTVNCVSAHTLRTDTQLVDLDDQLARFLELESIGIRRTVTPYMRNSWKN